MAGLVASALVVGGFMRDQWLGGATAASVGAAGRAPGMIVGPSSRLCGGDTTGGALKLWIGRSDQLGSGAAAGFEAGFAGAACWGAGCCGTDC
jgi:hypothetical protein